MPAPDRTREREADDWSLSACAVLPEAPESIIQFTSSQHEAQHPAAHAQRSHAAVRRSPAAIAPCIRSSALARNLSPFRPDEEQESDPTFSFRQQWTNSAGPERGYFGTVQRSRVRVSMSVGRRTKSQWAAGGESSQGCSLGLSRRRCVFSTPARFELRRPRSNSANARSASWRRAINNTQWMFARARGRRTTTFWREGLISPPCQSWSSAHIAKP